MKHEYELLEFIRGYRASGLDAASICKSAKIEFAGWQTDEAILAALSEEIPAGRCDNNLDQPAPANSKLVGDGWHGTSAPRRVPTVLHGK